MTGGVRGERFQDMLEEDEAIRPGRGPGDEHGRQPRVAPHDRARLLADGEEVGEPVTGRGGERDEEAASGLRNAAPRRAPCSTNSRHGTRSSSLAYQATSAPPPMRRTRTSR